jgi:hypothetical protein
MAMMLMKTTMIIAVKDNYDVHENGYDDYDNAMVLLFSSDGVRLILTAMMLMKTIFVVMVMLIVGMVMMVKMMP